MHLPAPLTSEKANTESKGGDFLREAQAILSEARVLTGSAINRYHENCLSVERRIVGVLQPENEAHVIAIVHIANRYRIPLYTISTGHNWGYGSSIPVVDDCAILELSRMNNIKGFDAELGLVTLEPGVTQHQLMQYLKDHKLDFYVPTTGAGPTTSIVGNALERGFGMTPDEDHFRAVTSVRAVLADGTIYQSCFTENGAPPGRSVEMGNRPLSRWVILPKQYRHNNLFANCANKTCGTY